MNITRDAIVIVCAIAGLLFNIGVVIFALGKLFANVSSLRKDFNGFAMRVNEGNQNVYKLLQQYGYDIGYLRGRVDKIEG